MKSIWSQETSIAERKSLQSDIQVDVAVIGAGMAGILIAHYLHQRDVNVVVLEASRIGSGQTKNTTAKITSQHHLIYDTLLTKLGEEQARQYAEANQSAIYAFRRIIDESRISCHFEDKSAYIYDTNDARQIEKEVIAANKAGIDATYVTETKLPFPVKAAIRFDYQAQFNPLEFLRDIAKPLTIYENTMARSIESRTVMTDYGKVKAKSIVVATHYPFMNVPGFYFMRMHQDRSYVLALGAAPDVEGMYIDANEQGYSLRNYGDQLLLGGSGHRCGENSAGGQYEKLRAAAKQFFPGSKEQACWSAQDCIPLDGVPYIGQYGITTPSVYVATGFQKWGMTSSMVAAQIISDRILENENPYEKLFSPQRFHLSASVENMISNGYKSAKGLVRELVHLPDTITKELPDGHGGVVEYENKKVGVYKDHNGALFMVSVKCPHLGCQLEWNPDELSWDCPCHGSRFDYKGNLIDNPAMEGLSCTTKSGY